MFNMKDVNILSIESSCDETSMAIIRNGCECVQCTVLTQMDTHAEFGGVVPEIASREHVKNKISLYVMKIPIVTCRYSMCGFWGGWGSLRGKEPFLPRAATRRAAEGRAR